jgi:hypothetical protein
MRRKQEMMAKKKAASEGGVLVEGGDPRMHLSMLLTKCDVS